MWLDRIISGLVGDMKENRKAVVIKVCMTYYIMYMYIFEVCICKSIDSVSH